MDNNICQKGCVHSLGNRTRALKLTIPANWLPCDVNPPSGILLLLLLIWDSLAFPLGGLGLYRLVNILHLLKHNNF